MFQCTASNSNKLTHSNGNKNKTAETDRSWGTERERRRYRDRERNKNGYIVWERRMNKTLRCEFSDGFCLVCNLRANVCVHFPFPIICFIQFYNGWPTIRRVCWWPKCVWYRNEKESQRLRLFIYVMFVRNKTYRLLFNWHGQIRFLLLLLSLGSFYGKQFFCPEHMSALCLVVVVVVLVHSYKKLN